MSMEALLIATVRHLREELRYTTQQCDIQPDGRPPATMGEFYVAIDEAGVQSNEKTHLRETFSITVTITRRTAPTPRDRRGSLYADRSRALAAIERPVIVAVHNNQTLRALANAELGAPQENLGDQILQPLWYAGRSRTRYESAEWCGAGGNDNDAFMVRTLNFQGGLRVQAMDIAK